MSIACLSHSWHIDFREDYILWDIDQYVLVWIVYIVVVRTLLSSSYKL